MTNQQKMAETLAGLPIPHKQIQCYGRQIVITSHCLETARKWAMALSDFAKVKGVQESVDEASEQKGTCLNPTMVKVWRTYAAVV